MRRGPAFVAADDPDPPSWADQMAGTVFDGAPADPLDVPCRTWDGALPTAVEAALLAQGRAAKLRRHALLLIAASKDGLTADEVGQAAGERPTSMRPRVADLKSLGLIRWSKPLRRAVPGYEAGAVMVVTWTGQDAVRFLRARGAQ